MNERDRFDKIAREVWETLKSGVLDQFRNQIQRMELILMDEPDPALIKELPGEMAEHPEEICGLHSGIPITEESVLFPSSEPTRVYLFRKALRANAGGPGDKRLREEILITLLHEVGHHFGLDEDDLDRLGFG